MSAEFLIKETYILVCKDHAWFAGTSDDREAAELQVQDHNTRFHSDPEKEESWPSHT